MSLTNPTGPHALGISRRSFAIASLGAEPNPFVRRGITCNCLPGFTCNLCKQ